MTATAMAEKMNGPATVEGISETAADAKEAAPIDGGDDVSLDIEDLARDLEIMAGLLLGIELLGKGHRLDTDMVMESAPNMIGAAGFRLQGMAADLRDIHSRVWEREKGRRFPSEGRRATDGR